jgi:hypothetical protein
MVVVLFGLNMTAVCAQSDEAKPTKQFAPRQTDAVAEAVNAPAVAAKKSAAQATKQGPGKGSQEQLVDLDLNRSMGRLDDLERRVYAMERGNRFLEDEVRNLDRELDDLKRSIR